MGQGDSRVSGLGEAAVVACTVSLHHFEMVQARGQVGAGSEMEVVAAMAVTGSRGNMCTCCVEWMQMHGWEHTLSSC